MAEETAGPFAETAERSTETEPELFEPGERFHGYVVERPLGKGGLGAVYLCRHETLDAYFALKVLYPSEALKNPEFVRRFTREARLALRIRHPNLVAVHDAGHDAETGLHYMVMDYVTGASLRMRFGFGGQMPVADAARIVRSVAEALSAGEQLGLVHRDLKPENVMETNEGAIKLIDFGVAKTTNMTTDSLCTLDNTVFGTPNYVSPEQAVDSRDVDARSDIYSLGIIFWEALAGRHPYADGAPGQIVAKLLSPDPVPDIRTVRDDVPVPLATLIAKMCAKRRDDRPPVPSAVVAELTRLGFGPSGAPPPPERIPLPGDEPVETSMEELLRIANASLPPPAPRPRGLLARLRGFFGRRREEIPET